MTAPKDWVDALSRAVSVDGAPSSDYDLNKGVKGPTSRQLRPAAVLIAVETWHNSPRVVLTQRSSKLKHHPGQIAFPGGKVDPSDADATGAALREAREEVGLPEGAAEVLGTLPAHETVTGFSVVPVLAVVPERFVHRPEAGEVVEAFTVPLAHVTDQGKFLVEGRDWQGTKRLYYAVPYGPYYIWGATARILRALADRMVS